MNSFMQRLKKKTADTRPQREERIVYDVMKDGFGLIYVGGAWALGSSEAVPQANIAAW